MKPSEVLQRLKNGNNNFANGHNQHPLPDIERLKQLNIEGQADHAFATIVTCSDSRVAPELIFDCGLGDLFVIRSAGNSCFSEESLCSVEFGITSVKTSLIVVMGHSSCGAIISALKYNNGEKFEGWPNVSKVAEKLGSTLKTTPDLCEKTVEKAVKSNVKMTISRLREGIPCLSKREEKGTLIIAGAYYSLASGIVSWL